MYRYTDTNQRKITSAQITDKSDNTNTTNNVTPDTDYQTTRAEAGLGQNTDSDNQKISVKPADGRSEKTNRYQIHRHR